MPARGSVQQTRVSDGKPGRQEEAMSNSRYYVVGNNDVWMVQVKDTGTNQHKTNNEAPSLAIAAAQRLAMRGELAHVCVLDDNGRFRDLFGAFYQTSQG